MFPGGFGPIDATQLTGLLSDVVARAGRQLVNTVLHDVQYRAGQFYAIAEVTAHDQTAQDITTYYGLTTASVPSDAHGYRATIDATQLFVWEHPADPFLPGLRLAAIPSQVQRHFAPTRDITALQAVIYRPMNRAVFRAQLSPGAPGAPPETLFLKVLRPGAAQPVYAMHQTLAAAGIPVVAAAPPVDDVLALVGGRGVPLGEYLRSQRSHSQFQPLELLDILDRFPREVMQRPQQASWADRYPEFVRAARGAMPEHQDRLASLGRKLAAAHATIELGPIVPTHGDFYEAHIFVHPGTGRMQQLLDVDGAGPGYRVDDFACLVGHLAVLGYDEPQAWGWQAAMHTFQQLAPHTRGVTLAVRAAAVVLSLIPAYQPTRALKARGHAYLRIAEALLDMV